MIKKLLLFNIQHKITTVNDNYKLWRKNRAHAYECQLALIKGYKKLTEAEVQVAQEISLFN